MKSLYNSSKLFFIAFFVLLSSCQTQIETKEDVLKYMKTLGKGSWMFGQVATWVHNENPDMDDPSNWLKKVYDHAGKIPRYGVVTYDFIDFPFPDSVTNAGVKNMWDRGLIAGVYTFYANPNGGHFRDSVEVRKIFETGENPIKSNFYSQMDRMAANFQWLEDQKVPVIYTPFVELDGKWYPKDGRENAVKLYRLVHDYFTEIKGLDNIIWAYHTMEDSKHPSTPENVMESYYPGDKYVDIIGKSGYGPDLSFPEYDWAVQKKKNDGKIIWWSELGINNRDAPPRDCFDVLDKLENSYPELAGFVFWSDAGHYNITGNLNGPEFMADPRIITLE